MTQLGAIVRLLMLFACLVPTTGTRKALAAPLGLPAPTLPAPIAPAEEEDTRQQSEEETACNEKLRSRTSHFVVARPFTEHPPFTLSSLSATRHVVPGPAPSPADPFRNGLGCPFRC
jgi:hypothetical protein